MINNLIHSNNISLTNSFIDESGLAEDGQIYAGGSAPLQYLPENYLYDCNIISYGSASPYTIGANNWVPLSGVGSVSICPTISGGVFEDALNPSIQNLVWKDEPYYTTIKTKFLGELEPSIRFDEIIDE